ncbi:MAG: efflux transporter outer membrane subunit [Acetobacterales bacterium]
MKLRTAALLAVVLGSAGCTTVGPDYERPPLQPGERYQAPVPSLVGQPADLVWWRGFRDPLLDELVRRGLTGNLDIQTAAARIREARAALHGARSDRLPSLDGQAGATVRSSRDFGDDSGRSSRNGGNSDDDDSEGNLNVAALFGWSADLFGGLRRSEQAARAELLRQAWLREDAGLAVAADIVRTYVELRGQQRRLELATQSLELQQQTLDIVRSRVDAGLAPQLELAQAQAAVASLRADIAPIARDIRLATNALAVLVGERPGDLQIAAPETAGAIPVPEAAPPLGMPADLLRRRPDLQAAEYDLVRATAEIGVQEADLYPQLRLPGSLTLGVDGLGTGAIGESVVAALSATLDIPVADGGRRRAEVDAAEAQAAQALYAYRGTLLTALREVEGAMHSYEGARLRLQSLDATVEANERAYEQARTLYTQGLVNFIEVLDSQRALTESLQQRAIARTSLASTFADLYQAAGFSPCSTGLPSPPDTPVACLANP